MNCKFIKSCVFILLFVFMLTGCNKSKAIGDDEAKALVKDFINTFQKCEYENLYPLTSDGGEYYRGIYIPEEATNELLFNYFSEKLDYNIKSVKKVNDTTVTVNVELTNVKAEELVERIQAQYLAYCQANEDVLDDIDLSDLLYKVMEYELGKDDIETQTVETEFNVIYNSDKWILEGGIIIYDDMTGGYITYYYKNNIFGGLESEQLKEMLKEYE